MSWEQFVYTEMPACVEHLMFHGLIIQAPRLYAILTYAGTRVDTYGLYARGKEQVCDAILNRSCDYLVVSPFNEELVRCVWTLVSDTLTQVYEYDIYRFNFKICTQKDWNCTISAHTSHL